MMRLKTMSNCADDHCLTCSDEVLPVRVMSIDEQACLALVEIDGKQEEVDISLVGQITPGDMLLVHGGVALARQAERRES
jgi:hydrogenase maturation factor